MNAPFRKKRFGPVLSAEQGARQGSVVRSARSALSNTEAVRDFLNSHHGGLKGRPLDLAIASEAGLRAVQEALETARIEGLGAPSLETSNRSK